MAYVISDECVACGTCAGECPVEAISEGDGKYVIDADTCVECGTCAGVCPVEAPEEEQNKLKRQRNNAGPNKDYPRFSFYSPKKFVRND